MRHLTDRIVHTTSFVTPLMKIVGGTRKLSVGPSRWIDQTTYCNMSVLATTELRFSSYAGDKLKVQTKKIDYSHRMNWKEGNVFLFNDALNTFYLRLYGVRPMVKDHSDSERGNPLPSLHGLLFY